MLRQLDTERRSAGRMFLRLGIFVWFLAVVPVQAQTVIKTALVTPEGSTWTETLRDMSREVLAQTQGEVRFQIYPGGVSGDELDVLRKMRAGRIHAAGFSGVGLGVLMPRFRVLEAPLLFRSYAEIDQIRTMLYDDFKKDFESKGFVLLGFAEAGWVYLFSKTPIASPSQLHSIKMWIWQGDAIAETFLETMGIGAYPLHLSDVHTGLETGMIDSFYSPALGAVAFQWYPRIRYMLDYPLVDSGGAFLMNKRTFQRLSPHAQHVVRELALTYCRRLIERTRQDNRTARKVMQDSGVEFLTADAQLVSWLQSKAKESYQRQIPDLYSQRLLDRVQKELAEIRSATPEASSQK